MNKKHKIENEMKIVNYQQKNKINKYNINKNIYYKEKRLQEYKIRDMIYLCKTN